MDNLENIKTKSLNKPVFQIKDELKSPVFANKTEPSYRGDISREQDINKKRSSVKETDKDLNVSISELDMAMISDAVSFGEDDLATTSELSGKDLIFAESAKMQSFLKKLKKTGSTKGNDILSEIEQLLERYSYKWQNELSGVKLDESLENEMIERSLDSYHEVQNRLYELAGRYLQSDKYWISRSGYRRKDLCQEIVKWASKDDRLLSRWESRMVSSKINAGFGRDCIERNKKNFDIVKDRIKNEPKDTTLTKETRENLHKIDTWILKHTDFSPGNNGMEELQASLMRLSTRERLCVYYLIESDKRKDGDDLDIALSQFNYVPDYEKFKSAMVSKKIWKGFGTNSRVLWNKLSDAMLRIKGINFKGGFAAFEDINEKAKKREEDRLKEKDNADIKKEDDKESESIIDTQLEENYKLRNLRMEDAIKKLKAYKHEYEKYEKIKSSGKEDYGQKSKTESSYGQLINAFNLLSEADKLLPALKDINGQKSDLKKESVERKEKADYALSLINTGAAGAGSVDSAASFGDYVRWGFVDTLIEMIPVVKAGAGGLSALAGISAMMVDISLMVNLRSELNAPAITERIIKLGSLTTKTVNQSMSAAATTKSFINGVPVTDLTKDISKQLKILSGVSAGLLVASNIAEHISISKESHKTKSAGKILAERHLENEQQAKALGRELSDKELSEKRLENTILSMQQRVLKNRRKIAWVDTSAAAMALIALIPIAGFGAASAGVIGAAGVSYVLSKKGREKLADDVVSAYIKDRFDAEYELRYGYPPEDYTKLDKKKKELFNKRKKSIENYIFSGLGYSDREKFIKAIQKEMAVFLHDKLFFNEAGQPIYREDINEDEALKQNRKPYTDLAYGLGFDVKYPHRPGIKKGSSTDGKPSARKLYLKMKF